MVDHGHEHGVAIAKVILDHTPGHPGRVRRYGSRISRQSLLRERIGSSRQ